MASFRETGDGVLVRLDVKGLSAGLHAVHIHAIGKCEGPAFISAGGHFNPAQKKHGYKSPDGPHAGDLPNMLVAKDGSGRFEALTDAITLRSGPNSVFDADGSALVVHVGVDDNVTDPTGNAGDRAACRLGFALDSMPTDRVRVWYDESDLPALAGIGGNAITRAQMFRSTSEAEADACIQRREVDACRHMLVQLPNDAIRPPMPDVARASLVRVALEIGGADALRRMRTSAGSTVGEQLASAAGVSVDHLLTRWMARVSMARPSPSLPSAIFVLASLACICACLAWAVRGQPWR